MSNSIAKKLCQVAGNDLPTMSMEYIRNHYGVPAKRGARIKFTGTIMNTPLVGTIVYSRNQYLLVKMDNDHKIWTLHPTWEIEYLPEGT